MEIKTEEVTSIKPVTDEKNEKHLYHRLKKKKKEEQKKEKKFPLYKDKGKIIDIYA
jgi:NCAIR mutase (PurE)-related protein